MFGIYILSKNIVCTLYVCILLFIQVQTCIAPSLHVQVRFSMNLKCFLSPTHANGMRKVIEAEDVFGEHSL